MPSPASIPALDSPNLDLLVHPSIEIPTLRLASPFYTRPHPPLPMPVFTYSPLQEQPISPFPISTLEDAEEQRQAILEKTYPSKRVWWRSSVLTPIKEGRGSIDGIIESEEALLDREKYGGSSEDWKNAEKVLERRKLGMRIVGLALLGVGVMGMVMLFSGFEMET